jgi:polyhydroxyalkanoate synthase subunit PhaC
MSTSPATPSIRRSSPDVGADASDVAGALDLLLTDAALGPTRRFFPGVSGVRFARALARRPRVIATRAGELAGEVGRIAIGTSAVAPSKRDQHPVWMGLSSTKP